jgi:hypothetical protein
MSGRTLVLNSSGEPHSIIPHDEAIVLVLSEKAFMVEGSGVIFHSPSIEVEAPSVLQLNRYVKLPASRRSVMLTRKNVCARDRHVCAYGDEDHPGDTMDHIIPKAKGGEHSWLNVVCSCRHHNQQKGRKTLEELGWELKYEPFRPHGIGVYLRSLNPQPDWEKYLV